METILPPFGKYKKFMQVLNKKQPNLSRIHLHYLQIRHSGQGWAKRCSESCEVPPSFVADHDCDVSLLPNNLPAISTNLFYVPPIIVLFPIKELMSDHGLTVYS